MQDEDGGPNIDVNLCKLLNIDVDGIALRIAMGEDPWADENEKEIQEESNTKMQCTPEQAPAKSLSQKKVATTANSTPETCLNKTDMKHSTVISMTRES